MDTDLTTIIGHVDGLEGLLGTIDADTSGIITSVQLLDDTVVADDAAFTPATTKVIMAGFEYDDTLPDSVDEGDAGAARMSANRNQYVQIRDNAGNERGLNIDANGEIQISGTRNAVAVTNAGITTIAGAVSGTEMQVDVLTMPSVAVTNAGTFATQVDGAALTALQLIDDIVYTDDTSTHATGTSKGALIMGAAVPTDTAVNANDIGAIGMTTDRRMYVEATIAATQTLSTVTTVGTVTAVTGITNALPAGTNAIGKLAANSGVDIGDVDVTSISAGTNTIGNVGIVGRATGGLSIHKSIDIDESEEEVKATAGTLYSILAFNRTAAPLYLKFYNLTAANTTVGTSTPVITVVVPANADSDGAGFTHSVAQGYAFDTAISVACTTGVADADTGAPGANDCVILLGFL